MCRAWDRIIHKTSAQKLTRLSVVTMRFSSARPMLCVPKTVRLILVTELPNVSGDDRSVLPLPGPVRLTVQVEEPT
jgi:hypothetical protein